MWHKGFDRMKKNEENKSDGFIVRTTNVKLVFVLGRHRDDALHKFLSFFFFKNLGDSKWRLNGVKQERVRG